MDERDILLKLISHSEKMLKRKDDPEVWAYAVSMFKFELEKMDNDIYNMY